MEYNNISTNILRDESKDLNYVVTPNANQIFGRIVNSQSKSNKSFTLIGNYGTGKSTFLWALEKTLIKEKPYFSSNLDPNVSSYNFIKLVGDNSSLTNSLLKTLKLKESTSKSIIEELERQRVAAAKKNNGLILIIDEFGKFLEYIGKNKQSNDLYLLQLISEWANDNTKEVYFIITLHQSFISYSSTLDISEKLEWEKIKGRFIELPFNEPVEQLLFFASKKLQNIQLPKNKEDSFKLLNKVIKSSNLVNFNEESSTELAKSLYPLDWLSANILVNALQRYGQNERSLFTFLNDTTKFSISSFEEKFYSVSNVFDYLANTLGSEIYSFNNPHRSQWQTCFRALERVELITDMNYELVSEMVKTICLVNIFTKAGSLFDKETISKYIHHTSKFTASDVEKTVKKLDKYGIIRFYKHSNKINFLEGTDIDIEQELADVSKEINHDFSVTEEISSLVDFPIILVKKHSFEQGTPRFFEFKILTGLSDIDDAHGALDGFINLIFDTNVKEEDVKTSSLNTGSNLFVIYKNSKEIHNEILTINKLKHLIKKHTDDLNAKKLLKSEEEHHTQQLQKLVLANLFVSNDKNIWFYNGKTVEIKSKRALNETLSVICKDVYKDAPEFKNELVNKEFLSAQISTARKSFIRHLLNKANEENLGFPHDKFPPEKSIYITLVKDTGIHSKNNKLNHFTFTSPTDKSFEPLWNESNAFLKSANSSRRNLAELYAILSKAPFKLKKGFTEFWIPLFLIINKEDFALFHETNGFIPYLTDDILDLIHKAPANYSLKSYDVSGLKVNLLESYKELVQVGDAELGTKSTFLSIYGNFLRFFRGLNEYTLSTKKLSPKAISLREAIKNAKDPEDALFNQFPNALGFHSISIKDDEEVLKIFTTHIQDAIREIRSAYDALLDRIENTIIKSFICESSSFKDYKTEIKDRLNSVNLSLLGTEQAIFYKRLISPLDDRASWLKSVADAALGKSIDKMIDEEEILLVNTLESFLLGLIRASDLHEYKSAENRKMVSIQMTGSSGTILDDNIIVSNEYTKEFEGIKMQLKEKLGTLDVHQRKQLLMELLSTELNKELVL
jgi:energy-coupling factor transporter ATP-binding protein EcfA2